MSWSGSVRGHGWFPHNSDGVRVDKIMISQYHGPQEQKKLFKNTVTINVERITTSISQ